MRQQKHFVAWKILYLQDQPHRTAWIKPLILHRGSTLKERFSTKYDLQIIQFK